jgi:hypothetical protein
MYVILSALLNLLSRILMMSASLFQQAQGGLGGEGASASVYPSPITGGASFYTAAPASTNTSPATTKTGTGAPAATTSKTSGGNNSGALSLNVNALLLTVSGALIGGAAVLF